MSRINFKYTNWRGETSNRYVTPELIFFGSSKYHKGEQWFMRAMDHTKGDVREFALADCTFPPETPQKNLNDYAHECHQDNMKWWVDPLTGEKLERNKGELLCLIHSEISECMEGERKDIMDDKLPHLKMAVVEMADAQIRIFDYCAAHEYDLEGAYQEKRLYNATRVDHTHEARALENGKKW